MVHADTTVTALRRCADKYESYARSDEVPEWLFDQLHNDAEQARDAAVLIENAIDMMPDRGKYRFRGSDVTVGDVVLLAPSDYDVRRVVVTRTDNPEHTKASIGIREFGHFPADGDALDEAIDGGHFGGVTSVSNVLAIVGHVDEDGEIVESDGSTEVEA